MELSQLVLLSLIKQNLVLNTIIVIYLIFLFFFSKPLSFVNQSTDLNVETVLRYNFVTQQCEELSDNIFVHAGYLQ